MDNFKVLSLLLSLLGIIILILILNSTYSLNNNQILNITVNEKISFSGKIIKQSSSGNYQKITLDNNIAFFCKNPCQNYVNSTIHIISKYDAYYDRLIALSISFKNIDK